MLKIIKDRKALIESITKEYNQDHSATTEQLNTEQYQRLSFKRLDFLDILLLTKVIVCVPNRVDIKKTH